MSKLPRISGRECVKALAKAGFYLKRREGSHIILRRDDPFAQIVIPAPPGHPAGGGTRGNHGQDAHATAVEDPVLLISIP